MSEQYDGGKLGRGGLKLFDLGREKFADGVKHFTRMIATSLGKDSEAQMPDVQFVDTQERMPVEMQATGKNQFIAVDPQRDLTALDAAHVHGLAVRMVAPNKGDVEGADLVAAYRHQTGDHSGVGQKTMFNLAAVTTGLASLGYVAHELPGAIEAVVSSYTRGEWTDEDGVVHNMNENCAERLRSDEVTARLNAAYSLLVREAFGVGTGDDEYPSIEDREFIRATAREMAENAPGIGVDRTPEAYVKETLVPLISRYLEEPPEEEEEEQPGQGDGEGEGEGDGQGQAGDQGQPGEGQGGGGSTPGPEPIFNQAVGQEMKEHARVDTEEEAQAKAEEALAKEAGQGGKSAGTSTPEFQNVIGQNTKSFCVETPATEIFRRYLVGEVFETARGFHSGRFNSPRRLFSDLRVMKRRHVEEDTPDTLLVWLTDTSGSMTMGGRWETACVLHDAAMLSLYRLGISAMSAGYDQAGYADRITPINAPDRQPVKMNEVIAPRGGTGDLGAVRWATEQLDQASKRGRVVVIVSDNEGPTDPAMMKRLLRKLNASIVHVSLVPGPSQYGVDPIYMQPGYRIDEKAYEQLAKQIRTALKLDVEE